jgi:hypothetical protein
LKPEWWGHHWLKGRSTREERKPVTRNDDDDDDNNNNNNTFGRVRMEIVVALLSTVLAFVCRV